jgi:hypothetical protein
MNSTANDIEFGITYNEIVIYSLYFISQPYGHLVASIMEHTNIFEFIYAGVSVNPIQFTE